MPFRPSSTAFGLLALLFWSTSVPTTRGVAEALGMKERKVAPFVLAGGITGALLWKAQHPDVENYYGSKHQKAGVECSSCHMPKVKDKKTGKTFTSHFAVTPKVQLKETCLSAKCHPKWTEEEAKYSIDSIKAFGKGKMRKAEFWLAALIDKIVEGKKAGLAADVIAKAQDHHLKAHILWEFWTAENSDGFHNPALLAKMAATLDHVRSELERQYISQGRYAARIDVESHEGTGTTVRVTFPPAPATDATAIR